MTFGGFTRHDFWWVYPPSFSADLPAMTFGGFTRQVFWRACLSADRVWIYPCFRDVIKEFIFCLASLNTPDRFRE